MGERRKGKDGGSGEKERRRIDRGVKRIKKRGRKEGRRGKGLNKRREGREKLKKMDERGGEWMEG